MVLVAVLCGAGLALHFTSEKNKDSVSYSTPRLSDKSQAGADLSVETGSVAETAPEASRVSGASETSGRVVAAVGGVAEVVTAKEAEPAAVSQGEPGAQRTESEKAKVLEKIQAAVVSYDASVGPILAPYLVDADPLVREAARDGLVQAGDAAGAKFLREAVEKIKDPREAVALLDAADFLELPPAPLATGPKRPAAKPVKAAAP